MASILSGLKTQAMAMIPQLITNAEPQIEIAVKNALQKMTLSQKELFSKNLDKLNTVVQEEVTNPTAIVPVLGGKKHKTRKHKNGIRRRTFKH